MNHETFQQTSELASDKLTEILPEDLARYRSARRKLAREAIQTEMDKMTEAGKILKLTDEEIRLLRSFRRFKATAKKAGEVFKWQTTPALAEVLVMDGGEPVHITDPQDVSGR